MDAWAVDAFLVLMGLGMFVGGAGVFVNGLSAWR
jgi:hypothetical protein